MLRGQIADDLTVLFQCDVVFLAIWQLASQIFVRDGGQENQAQRIFLLRVGLDVGDERLIVGLELLKRTAVERAGHAVADDRHRRLDLRDLFLKLQPPFVRGFVSGLTGPEAIACDAGRSVAGPADVTKVERLALILHREPVLKVTVLLHLLNQAVPDEHDLVSANQVELLLLARK